MPYQWNEMGKRTSPVTGRLSITTAYRLRKAGVAVTDTIDTPKYHAVRSCRLQALLLEM